MTEDDPDALHERIRALEAELAAAERQLERLRALESDNDELRERNHQLSTELLSLSPPRLPKFSFPVEGMGDRASAESTRRKSLRGRFNASQISLGVILVAVVLAWIPSVLSWLDEHDDRSLYTGERGIRVAVAPRSVPERVVADASSPIAEADAGSAAARATAE